VNADIAAVTAALPHGSLLGAQSWLTAKEQATSSFAPCRCVRNDLRGG